MLKDQVGVYKVSKSGKCLFNKHIKKNLFN